jgi:hypothetical protein
LLVESQQGGFMDEKRSIYSRGGSGMTTGGLDAYLGPDAQDYSSLPENIEDPEKIPDAPEVDCTVNSTEAVCQIAEAEKQVQAGSEKKGDDSVSSG